MLPEVSSQAKRATYQDVLDAPEGVVAEVIDGVLHTQPRPRVRHAIAASRLGAALLGEFGSRDAESDGWVILDEPELHLGADVVVPDLAGWRRERFPDDLDAAFISVVPDWACEVLSPSTASKDRTLKLPLYAQAGVSSVWLLDPGPRTLEVLVLDGDTWRLAGTYGADARVTASPFGTFELELGRLWTP
jgi:Uma2 family endonuclease